MPATPTNIQPPGGGIILTDYPELSALVAYSALGASENVTLTWQIASDSGFTTGLITVTTSQFYPSGTVVRQGIGAQLGAGTWYVRCRSTDASAVNSAWSPVNQFTIEHRPYTNQHSPAQGQSLSYGTGLHTFSWVFADQDPGDVQTAYQVVIRRSSNDSLVVDTGKVASAAQFHNYTFAIGDNSGYFYWTVKVWDYYDIPSEWSSPIQFQMGLAPIVTVLAPGSSVDVPNPTIQWSFVTSNAPQNTYDEIENDYTDYDDLEASNANYTALLASSNPADQAAYRVIVREGLALVHDSTWLSGSASTYVLPAVIHQGPQYTVTVSVRDAALYEGTSSQVVFTGVWDSPDEAVAVLVNLDGVDDPAVGAVQITWNAEAYDISFKAWRVYRRLFDGTSYVGMWELIGTSYETFGRGEILDYTFQPGETYAYAVVQVATRFFDEEAESNYAPNFVTPISEKYWIVVPTNPSLNTMLSNVISDSYSEAFEMQETAVIGRGRRIEYGTRFGYIGSLSAQLRGLNDISAAEERRKIEAIKKNREAAFLRVPFGHLWLVALGDVQVSRVPGVGLQEFVDVTIPYSEIAT
jgi:hypothetical protein